MILENMILDNVKNMPPSGIRKYFDMVNEMDDVISLGVGEPDFVTPWNVREAGIYSIEQGHTHYSSNLTWPIPISTLLHKLVLCLVYLLQFSVSM